MNWLANVLGGKPFLVWVASFFAMAFGRLDPDTFHMWTMAYMVGQGVLGGIEKGETDETNKLWKVLGGRKFVAWASETVMLFLVAWPADKWMEVSVAYVGAVAAERLTRITTNGLSKVVAAKTATNGQ